ncbi:MAG: hypothetical protein ABIS84_08240 [Arachnia sp.]
MSNDLEFETQPEVRNEWGMHNGVVVLAAMGLVALALLLGWVTSTDLFAGAPLGVLGVLSSLGFVLMLAAGSVIGMLVGTRMLQAHVSSRGAKALALWGTGALAVSLVLQAGLVALTLMWQAQQQMPASTLVQGLSNLVTGTMAVGAAMVALAFVGRLRR